MPARRFDHDRSRFPLLGKHVDGDCKACHKTTNYRDAPSTCIGCHRADDKHERNLGEGCGACHGEKTWKIPRFDHEVTRFALRGGHAVQAVTCKSCHADLKHYRDTPRDCIGCHKKDDKHEAQLGERCESCHTDVRWRDTPRFDHARARFPLVASRPGSARRLTTASQPRAAARVSRTMCGDENDDIEGCDP